MRNKIETAKNILAELLNFMLALALMIIAFRDFVNVWSSTGRLMVLVVAPLLFYFAREKVKRAPLFFAIHILTVIAYGFLYADTSFEKVIFIIVTGVLAAVSINKRLTSDKQGSEAVNPIVMAGALLALYIVDGFQANGKSGGYLLQIMIIYMGIYLLYYYLRQVLKFVNINCRMTENVPVKRLISSSFGMVLVFIFVVVALLFLSVNRELIDEAAAKIGEFIKSIIRFFTSFFRYEGEVTITAEKTERIEGGGPIPATEQSAVSKFLDMLIYLGGSAFLLAVLVGAVITFYKLVRKAFGMRTPNKQVEKDVEEDRIESIKKEKKKKKKTERILFFPMSPQQTIRRIYYKVMSDARVIGKDVPAGQILAKTARENCRESFADVVKTDDSGQKEREIQSFYSIYEKARYSSADCDKEDIKRMKRSRDWLLSK